MARIGFDVDDTLWKIRKDDMDQVPDYKLIAVLMWFVDNGDQVYVWSAGGMDYASQIVRKLGLNKFVTVIQKGADATIDLTFDDEAVKLGTVNVRVKR